SLCCLSDHYSPLQQLYSDDISKTHKFFILYIVYVIDRDVIAQVELSLERKNSNYFFVAGGAVALTVTRPSWPRPWCVIP
ncbi:MAG: hypothetical protein O7D30_10240, partial [Rickettsia endosymbiont of Ixodes persulcatus]|nr:hypothetical protein [Rickettsia endosymbiont of Ixodes persulcatus]